MSVRNEPKATPTPQKAEAGLTWQAPARPFKKRNREYYTTIGAIVFLLAVILLFLREWGLIAVIVSLAFVAYVLAAVPPEKVEHRIDGKGLWSGGKCYGWGNLRRFWFEKKWGQEILAVEVKEGFPGRLALLLGGESRDQLKKLMAQHLSEDKPEEAWVDRAAGWLSSKVPLED